MEREQIKNKLPHGSLKGIAKTAGVSRNTVYKWFNEENSNSNVEQAVIAELKKLANHKKTQQQKVNNLLAAI